MSAGIALSCVGVSKSFDILDEGGVWRIILGRTARERRFRALNEVSLEVPKGKFVGVIGRNGAGKSTLLRTLGGVYAPDGGYVRVDGDLSGLYELGLSGNRDLSGREYARRVLEILGTPAAALDAAVAEVLDFSELGERFDDPLFSYSAGMSARLFFATATSRQHDVYLIDEVLSVGDEHFQQKCWRRVRERLAAGASGVLVTHDWSAVLRICETAHVLDRGRIGVSGLSDSVVRQYLGADRPGDLRTDIARFASELPPGLEWTSAEDSRLVVDVDVLRDGVPVRFVYAVERMTVGVGWEIVLNGIDLPVSSQRGRYRIEVVVPQLPLTPATYQLAISLVTVGSDARVDRTVLDSRGWLHGTPLPVVVSGRPSYAQLHLPVVWSESAR